MYYITEITFGTPQYDNTIALRDKILRQPLGLEFYAEDLALEYNQYHLACYDAQEQLVGCLVLLDLDGQELKMRQVAVDDDYQNQGIGTLLVAESELFAQKHGFQKMVLNARDVAIPFYEKLAYKKEGRSFTEVGIKHYKMTKKMT